MASDVVLVILAAGKGTRLKSARAKVLHGAGGRSLVEHVVRAGQRLRPRKMIVVVGHQADEVGALVKPLGAETVVQEPQRGTGHAVVAARRAIGSARFALVLPGDAPLIEGATLAALLASHRASEAAATVLTAVLDDPTGYGRIVRKQDGSVRAIVEEKAATEEERAIREVNSGIYCFTLARLWPCLAHLKPDNVHREFYLTDVIARLNEQGARVLAEVVADAPQILGCNTRAELAEVDRLFRARKRSALMEAGVTFYLPETVVVDAEVVVGPDTIIEPHVHLLGRTRIGANCVVRTGSVLRDAVLDDGATVKEYTLVASSRIGKGGAAGPFARLRDGAELRPGASVGNYVEVKKSVLAEGVKAMHLTYLGDAAIGRDSNVGAGTITCNYDGVNKNRTTIGRRVFVGSNTALVAPLRVGDGAYLAAGSTITEPVPPNALAVARGRQVNKPGWAARRRVAAPPRPKPRRKAGGKTKKRR